MRITAISGGKSYRLMYSHGLAIRRFMPVAKHPLFAIGIPPAHAGRAPPGRRPGGRAGRPLRSASVVVGRVTAEPFLVSAQSHHLVELGDTADHHCELAAFFCFPSRAL